MRCFILFLLYASALFTSKATKTDGVQVSVLTVMPYGNKVYTVYGHTALRIRSPKQNTDVVFNWGTFDFNTPYFLYRFLKGKADYFLSTIDHPQFIQSYNRLKVNVIEQVLYLPPKGREYLLQTLSVNVHPENRVYHYDFLKDNCTTRIRNLIEKAIESPLNAVDSVHLNTVRQLIHFYTHPYSWMTFGIDLLIGSEADKPLRGRDALFLPVQLKESLDNFTYDSGDSLVISSSRILQSNDNKPIRSSFWNSPMRVGWIFFCICTVMAIATTVRTRKYQKSRVAFYIFGITKACFAFLFLSTSVAGCLILFLALFSRHPCTSSNWNLFWSHPFHIIAFIGYLLRKSFLWITAYHWVNLITLFSLLLGQLWIPQNLNLSIIPYVFCLILASSFYLTRRNG